MFTSPLHRQPHQWAQPNPYNTPNRRRKPRSCGSQYPDPPYPKPFLPAIPPRRRNYAADPPPGYRAPSEVWQAPRPTTQSPPKPATPADTPVPESPKKGPAPLKRSAMFVPGGPPVDATYALFSFPSLESEPQAAPEPEKPSTTSTPRTPSSGPARTRAKAKKHRSAKPKGGFMFLGKAWAGIGSLGLPPAETDEDKIFLKSLEQMTRRMHIMNQMDEDTFTMDRASSEEDDRQEETAKHDRDLEFQNKMEQAARERHDRRFKERMEELAAEVARAEERRRAEEEEKERERKLAEINRAIGEKIAAAMKEQQERRREQERRIREERERKRREEERRRKAEEERRRQAQWQRQEAERQAREAEAQERLREFQRRCEGDFGRRERERAEAERLAREEAARQAEQDRIRREYEERVRAAAAATASLSFENTFQLYEAKWSELLTPNHQTPAIAFFEIPWPCLRPVASPDEITLQHVKEFIFHPLRPGTEGKTMKRLVRAEMLRWHPDKFQNSTVRRVQEWEQELVAQGGDVIAKHLTHLMREVE